MHTRIRPASFDIQSDDPILTRRQGLDLLNKKKKIVTEFIPLSRQMRK